MLAALSLVPAACGGDDEPATESPGSSTPAGSAPAAGGDGAQVAMKGFAFEPAEVTVKVGQTVTWKNEDSAQHDATGEGNDVKTPLIGQGETTDFTATKAGTFKYICSIHPSMKGTITVTE